MIVKLQNFRDRVKCVRNSASSPNPAEPISEDELVDVLDSLIGEFEKLERSLKWVKGEKWRSQ